MADAPDIKARRVLDNLGKNLARAQREREEALGEVGPAASEALDAGITKAEIVKRVGVSRPTLDRLLRE